MRRSSAVTVLLAVVLTAAPHLRAADPTTRPATTQAVISDAAFEQALDRAMILQQHDRTFEEILQSVAPRFPLITVCTEPGQCVWNKVTLNRLGKQVDAFRFRVPAGEPRDLVWCFLCNDLRYEWYILPVSGRMSGFRRNFYYKPQTILGDRTPKGSKDLSLQSLDAANLEPGGEYLIWFEFRHKKPMPMYVAINLLPASNDPATIESPEHITRALGLSPLGDSIAAIAVEPPPTQPSSERLPSAFHSE